MLLSGDRPGELVPGAYKGREQTLIKHKIVKHYIQAWAQKIASLGRHRDGRVIKIWYVDAFSGPWKSAHQNLEDTSICIGLDGLQQAAGFWKGKEVRVELGAIFVEKDARAFQQLKEYLASRRDNHRVDIRPFHGKFEDHVEEIGQLLGSDPAFIFVDPKGWTGAAMRFIAPLARPKARDVMINFMHVFINRARHNDLEYLPEQLAEFFGKPLQEGLDEEGLVRFYRDQLKEMCQLEFAADLIVEDPCIDQTKFRLVLGSHNFAAIDLFRDAERKIIGNEAPMIRAEAKENKRLAQTSQLAFLPPEPIQNHCYSELNTLGTAQVEDFLINMAVETIRYEELRNLALQECHITEADLQALLRDWKREERLIVENLKKGEKSIKLGHVLKRLKPPLPKQGDLFSLL